jgi:hypothetical protein
MFSSCHGDDDAIASREIRNLYEIKKEKKKGVAGYSCVLKRPRKMSIRLALPKQPGKKKDGHQNKNYFFFVSTAGR